MTFSDIINESRRLVKASDVSYTITDVVQSANNAMERVTSLIRQAEGRWQQDDSNNEDYPFATAKLWQDQQDYILDTDHLTIQRVEVKNQDGTWNKLFPFDEKDVLCQSLTQFGTPSGKPLYYDKSSGSLFLYPRPDYTQDSSIKLYYERGPSYFNISDTTKSPGFNQLFHRLISLWTAYDYAIINQLPVATTIRQEIQIQEDKLQDYYNHRDKDDKVQMRARRYNFT